MNEGSFYKEYKDELRNSNLSTFADLLELLKPFRRKATRMTVEEPSDPPEDQQMLSHFGGLPYFEKGEEWPSSIEGDTLDFVFQVFNDGEMELPGNIKLIQFYYSFRSFPWHSYQKGWKVKVYEELHPEELKRIPAPAGSRKKPYCRISFSNIHTLPDWEGISLYQPLAGKLSCVLNEDMPWANYQQACFDLNDDGGLQSQLGGYPHWLQGHNTPLNARGELLELLFQVDSEENAGLMWSDMGLVYVFYDRDSGAVEFTLQSM